LKLIRGNPLDSKSQKVVKKSVWIALNFFPKNRGVANRRYFWMFTYLQDDTLCVYIKNHYVMDPASGKVHVVFFPITSCA